MAREREEEAEVATSDFPLDASLSSGSPRRAILGWLWGLVVLAAIIAVVLRFGDVRLFATTIRAASPAWVAAAVVLQVATYAFAAAVWHRVLKRGGAAASLRSLFALAFLQLFANQAVPIAGLSGNVMVMYGLMRRGVSAALAITALLISALSYYTAYLLAGLLAFVLLWHRGDLSTAWLWLCAVFVAVIAVLALATLLLARWREGAVPNLLQSRPAFARFGRLLRRVRADLVGDVRLVFETVFLQGAGFALDALTLWCACRAVGLHVDFGGAFMSFVLASIVASLSLVPLGLGSFEGACIGMLHVLGAGLEASLAATLILRGLTLWVPMLPGLLLVRREAAISAERAAGNRPARSQ